MRGNGSAPAARPPVGSAVTIWARPTADLILILGEGTYDGSTYFNMQEHPVVRLNDGRECTVHYEGVFVAHTDHVKATCQRFGGAVVNWDIEQYLAGKMPDVAQLRGKSGTPVNGAQLQPGEPPTNATDQLLYYRRLNVLEEQKIEMFKKEIEKAEAKINENREKMTTIKSQVLAELEAIDKGEAVKPVVAPVVHSRDSNGHDKPMLAAPEVQPLTVEQAQQLAEDD